MSARVIAKPSLFWPVGSVQADADLELPAEAFARLVYGRLDADHTPSGEYGPALDLFRGIFPGP